MSFLVRTASPIGRLELTGDGVAVTRLVIERGGALPRDDEPERPDELLRSAVRQLEEYFAGERYRFDVPVQTGGTEFQRAIWNGLVELDFGQVTTYGALGRRTGRATAGRAVGQAIGANPVPLLVPCHRVLGSDGRITGYSAGEGLPTKQWLLEHEGVLVGSGPPSAAMADTPAGLGTVAAAGAA